MARLFNNKQNRFKMAECTTLESVPRGCGNNIGTMARFIFNFQSALTSVTIDEETGIVTAAVHTSAFKEVEFRKGQGQFTEASAIDLVAESTLEPITVAMNLKRRTGAKSAAIRAMMEGQPYLAGFAQDGNGIWWYLPNLQVSTLGGGTGDSRPVGSNYDLQLMNEEGTTPYEVDDAVIADILAAP